MFLGGQNILNKGPRLKYLSSGRHVLLSASGWCHNMFVDLQDPVTCSSSAVTVHPGDVSASCVQDDVIYLYS